MNELCDMAAVVFDVGNTLHHLDLGFIAATVSDLATPVTVDQVARAEYAAKHAIDTLFRARSSGDDSSRQLSYYESILAALQIPSPRWQAILDTLHAENRRSSLWRIMHASTPSVLAELQSRGYVLSVVSNADGRVAAAIEAKGTTRFFKTIIDSHVVGVEKPDARIFQMALDACAIEAARAVYVGDIYEIDVRGARAAGMTPVLLDPLSGYGEVDCVRITRLDDLIDLLAP